MDSACSLAFFSISSCLTASSSFSSCYTGRGRIYWQLAFTQPKAGREVGALNCTQEPKSVWDGPTSKATGHDRRLARDWPVPKSASVQACARTGTAGHCAVQRSWPVRTFSKSAILHRFPDFYTLRVEIFRIFFIHSRLPMTPYERWKVSGKSVRTFLRNPEGRQTHIHTYTHRRGSFI